MKSTIDMNTVFELDLSAIKRKLTHLESGEGWSTQQADAVEREYKRFLFLMKSFPDAQAAPSVNVDTFWHYHILDTMKYAADCAQVFGYFLHHYPYVGMEGGEDDAEVHAAAGEQMRAIYERTFGETYQPQVIANATRSSAGAAYCSLIRPAGNAPAPDGRHTPGASAYCGGIPPDSAVAYCGGIKPPRATSAYCGGVKPPCHFIAYCGGVKPPANDAAYCGGVKPPAVATAYCGGVKPPANDAAYCGGVKPPVAAAYCGGVKPPMAASAYCGGVKPPVGATAYCGGVKPPRMAASNGDSYVAVPERSSCPIAA